MLDGLVGIIGIVRIIIIMMMMTIIITIIVIIIVIIIIIIIIITNNNNNNNLVVYEQVCIEAAVEREGPAVQHGVALVQDHVPGSHGDIVGLALVVVHLDRPGLIQVLRHLDDGGGHEGEAVHVRSQHGAGGILPNAVEGRGFLLRFGFGFGLW